MSRIIYSKQYPKVDIIAELERVSGPAAADKPRPSAEEFFKDIEENLTYEPIPGRAEKKELFISKAKKFSKMYGISVKILEQEDGLQVMFISDHVMLLNGSLSKMADEIDIITHDDEITLVMAYYTHLRYLHGRLLSPRY